MLKNVLKVLRGPFGPVLVLDGPDLYKKNRTGPKRTGGPSVHYRGGRGLAKSDVGKSVQRFFLPDKKNS